MNDFIAVYPVTFKSADKKQVAREPVFFATAQLLSIRPLRADTCAVETLESPTAITISARFDSIAAAFMRRRIPTITLRGKVGNPFFEMTDVLLLPQNYNAPELNGDGYTRLTARPSKDFEIRTNDAARRALTVYTLTRPNDIQAEATKALSILSLKEPPAESFTARLQQMRTVHLPPVISQNSPRF